MHVDLIFPVLGDTLPVDHSYKLFSAISGLAANLHEQEDVGIFPINGTLVGGRRLRINRSSHLGIRLPSESLSIAYMLAGKALRIDDSTIRLQIPVAHLIQPATLLYSRLVVFKGHTEPKSFLSCAKEKLLSLGITHGVPSLVEQKSIQSLNEGKQTGSHSPYLRRTLQVKDSSIVGFALRVDQLTEEESIRLQEQGLGGRRHMGCGLFIHPAAGGK
ncbi:MAG: type I-MYXAN CRISPR-associated protein Cas6/Cmx6 [Deltaproteobacteria bacterium HGW-Deltaproteobacteria-22]|nr:MAG: type I-MYXAN CRISPR-associated protein Cas6/Cmx6 [Deltaproteobacteria bacterium HGW-Deltaproteobacteria-22]